MKFFAGCFFPSSMFFVFKKMTAVLVNKILVFFLSSYHKENRKNCKFQQEEIENLIVF